MAKSAIKSAVNAATAVFAVVELSAISTAKAVSGLDAVADDFRAERIGQTQFNAIKRQKEFDLQVKEYNAGKNKDEQIAFKLEVPEFKL